MNTKFKSIVTGAILEPNSEMVAEQLRKNPSFVVYDGQEAAQGDEKPLSKMNKDELLKVAQDAEIAVPDGATKGGDRRTDQSRTGRRIKRNRRKVVELCSNRFFRPWTA